ncbi:hypothetical protein LTS10_002070 [Elasticomyces elasticus]|nr:hypothetical protein LTS10_002070 [Elasticomyces elasticus]
MSTEGTREHEVRRAEAANDHARLIEETQPSRDLAVAELEEHKQKIKELDLDFGLENIGSINAG